MNSPERLCSGEIHSLESFRRINSPKRYHSHGICQITFFLSIMNISLENFENEIDETILDRGLEYFEAELVVSCRRTGNTVHAQVSGSEDYEVVFTLENESIVSASCDCPYDWGPVCKHIVAVMFELKDGNQEKHWQVKVSKKGNQSIEAQAEQILEKLSVDELKDVVSKFIIAESALCNRFVTAFNRKLKNPLSVSSYQKIMADIVDGYFNRYNFIGYKEADQLAAEFDPYEEQIRQAWKMGDYEKAFHLAFAIAEGIHPAVINSDDSYGSLGGVISNAMDLLEELSLMKLDEQLRLEFLAHAEKQIVEKNWIDWDWYESMLEIMGNLIRTHAAETRFFQYLDEYGYPNDDSFRSKYRSQLAAGIKYRYLQEKRPEEAEIFLEDHLHFDDFRKIKLTQLFEQKDYVQLIELARDGMHIDQEYTGLVHQWQDWIIKAEKARGNKNIVSQIARERFLSRPTMDDFHLLKENTPNDEWEKQRDEVLKEISGHSVIVNQILAEENLLDRLMEKSEKLSR